MRRPIWWLRALIALAMFGVIAITFWSTLRFLQIATGESTNMAELLQGVDAAINELIFLGLVLLFLVSVETRLKRRRALHLLHRLRSIAHVVDMHQLTKDPDYALHLCQPLNLLYGRCRAFISHLTSTIAQRC